VLERCTVIAERRVRALVGDVASREGRKRDRAIGVIQLEVVRGLYMYVCV
jgi:tetrahydromethanopterin S-methyltransferase subunit G